MAISRIAGQMLQTNLERDGVNLSFSNLDLGNSTPVLYLDVANNRVGINRSSADVTLDLVGNFRANGTIQSYAITAAGNVIPSANVTYDLGQPSFRWNNIYANLITANISSPGGNGEIVFNDGGVLGASPGLTFDKTSNSFSVSGNVAGANINTSGLITATGNVTSGNIITGGLITATGNVTGGNVETAGLVTATGNVTGGNINTGGVVSALGNVISPVIVTTTVTTNSGNLTLDSAGGGLQWTGTGNVIFNSQWINNLANPNQAQDAATKQYVDNAVSAGIHIHAPVDVETPTALPAATYAQGGTTYTVNQTIAGNIVVFSTAANLQVNDQLWFSSAFEGIQANVAYFVVSTPNTSAAVLSTEYNGAPVSNITSNASVSQSVVVNSGIGATLTATANGALTVDGFAVSAGNRVLVYNQVNQYENGVYAVTDAGNVSAPWILTRATDSDTYVPDTNDGIDQGSYYYVKYGNTGAGESYVLTQPAGPFIIGLANVEFTQFSASQVYSANTAAGINLSGTIFSAKVDNDTTAFDGGGNIAVKAGANLVTPNIGNATGNSLTLTGNGLIQAANISVTGNVDGGNINTAGLVTATGNVTGGNVTTAGVVTATGNVIGGNITTAGQVTATGNITGGNITTAGEVTATGNVAGGNLITAGIVTATGNVETGANLLVSGYANITGNLTVTANITGGNIETAGLVTATGNVTGGNVTTAGVVTATGNITGGNILTAGDVSATGNLYGDHLTTQGNALIGGDLVVQGNITYINVEDLQVEDPIIIMGTGPNGAPLVTNDGKDRGIFMEYYTTGIGNAFVGWDNSTGNMIIASDAAIANDVITVETWGTLQAGNLHIESLVSTGNIAGGNLLTGGVVSATGNITGGNITTAGVVTATGNVETNSNLVVAGYVTVTGNVTGGNLLTGGQITATGNVTGGNIETAGVVTATGNVTGGNLITSGLATITGNVIGGNITTAGEVTATGNVTGGNLVTAGLATVTGNVIGGNIETAGEVTATGNVTGGNLVTAGLATVTGNVIGGNITTAGEVSATGNITGGNLITSGSISTTGNLTGGNLLTSGVVSATGNITGGNIDTAGTATANNLIAYTLTSTGELGLYSGSSGNIIIDPNGTGMLQIVGTNGFVIPTGNTAQRPSPADTGTLRYNTEYDRLEVYDGTEWDSVVSDVTNQVIVPDGSSLNYTLDREATAPSVLVSINGLVQIPGIAYAYTVTGNTITFAEAPLTTDIIDIRFL